MLAYSKANIQLIEIKDGGEYVIFGFEHNGTTESVIAVHHQDRCKFMADDLNRRNQ